MKLKVESGGVPVGSYSARFVGIEPTEHEEYGAGILWKWEIVGGTYAGQIAGRITSPTPTVRNAAGKMLQSILGRPIQVDEEIDLDPCVGKMFLLSVAETKSGGTRVEAAIPAPVAA